MPIETTMMSRERPQKKKKKLCRASSLVLTYESYIFIYIGFVSDLLNMGDSHGFTLSCFSIQSHSRSKFQVPYASSCLTNLYFQPRPLQPQISKGPLGTSTGIENSAYIPMEACPVCSIVSDSLQPHGL